MPNEHTYEVRDLRNGDWYWIHKAVINEYVQKVGTAGIIVYSFLASLVDNNQTCFPSQKYVADKLGYSRATINRAMKRLEENGLVSIVKRSRYHCIYHLLKVRCNTGETQMSHQRNSDVSYFDTNNNKLTININNNNDIGDKNLLGKNFRPETKEELLALDIADALFDRKNLPLYLSYTKRYPEPFLRRILGEVKEVPYEKIKKSRSALFSYLIKKYAEETVKSLRD